MNHPIHAIRSFEIVGPYTLSIEFDDGIVRIIDFSPILRGEIYGPLREPALFGKVRIDPEINTLVWPNGADFDPSTLHDWPRLAEEVLAMARSWPDVSSRSQNQAG